MEFDHQRTQILHRKQEQDKKLSPETKNTQAPLLPKADEEEEIPEPTAIQPGIQRMAAGATSTGNNPVALTKSNLQTMTVNQAPANQSLAMTHPAAKVQRRLQGKGQALGGETKSRMENALGADLSGVKLHTGSEGDAVAKEHNAKALTVGQDIAFASGEYKPGTMEGDALLMHESHHTLQQKDAVNNPEAMLKEEQPQPNENAYEREADNAALAGTARLWGKSDSWLGKMAGRTKSVMKSGLGLQRCSPSKSDLSPLKRLAGAPEKNETRYFYLNSYDPNTFKRKLGKLNILAEPDYTPIKIPKKGEYYKIAVSFTHLTEKETKTAFNKTFPSGDIYINGSQDTNAVALDKLVTSEKSGHQHSFSFLEGSNLLNTAKDAKNACIGTMHKCLQTLYPIKDLSSFGDKSISTIKALEKQGRLQQKPIIIAATYGLKQIPGGSVSDITFSESIGNKIVSIVNGYGEDGFYDFPASIGNGFHSLHIVAAKRKGIVEIGWKDQTQRAEAGSFEIFTPDGLDKNIKEYLLSKQKYDIGQAWLRVTKTTTTIPEFHMKHIPAPKNQHDKDMIDKAKQEAYLTYVKDLKINMIGIAKPE